jgi:hypothetical protein
MSQRNNPNSPRVTDPGATNVVDVPVCGFICSDGTSVRSTALASVMVLCEVLAATDTRFHVEGFGSDDWRLDVSYDLSAVMEQLPGVIRALMVGADVELDFYSQGIERTLEFHPDGEICRISCVSRTSWTPSPEEIEMKTQDVIAGCRQLARNFGEAVAIAAPSLAQLAPFGSWATGDYDWVGR